MMLALLGSLYRQLKKEEIEKASTILKRMKIDTILQNLSKLCWKYNIQYEIIFKTNDTLSLKLSGNTEIVVFKYHKVEVVYREEVDFFLNELDENNANKGFYITTGEFATKNKSSIKSMPYKKDVILEDGFTFIKNNLGIKGRAEKDFKINKLNFFKYLPK
jgi:hypothetical protein